MKLSERMIQRMALFMIERHDPKSVPATYTEIEKWADEVAQLEAENERLREIIEEAINRGNCADYYLEDIFSSL